MGKPGQTIPPMSEEWVKTISGRYIELYEKVIGEKFVPEPLTDEELKNRIESALDDLNKLNKKNPATGAGL
jgi:phosphoribosylaminoimidazole-succinocarboxamide synthase